MISIDRAIPIDLGSEHMHCLLAANTQLLTTERVHFNINPDGLILIRDGVVPLLSQVSIRGLPIRILDLGFIIRTLYLQLLGSPIPVSAISDS